MPDFDFAAVESAVRKLATDNPDHVYQRGGPTAITASGTVAYCFYSPNSPGAVEGCLFGQALASLGVSDEFLGDREGAPVTDLLFDLGVNTNKAQDEWVTCAQSWQDGANWRQGVPWSVAVSNADRQIMPS